MGFKRTSTAVWRGTGLEGSGTLGTPSGVFAAQPYSFKARFQNPDGKAGTNPEELLTAAHAGCYAMALSFVLNGAGLTAEELRASATVEMDKDERGWFAKSIALTVEAKVPGVTQEKLLAFATTAKDNCPISRALASVPITLQATLV